MWRALLLSVLLWFDYWYCVTARECIYGDIQHIRCKLPAKPWAVDAYCIPTSGGTCVFPERLRFGFSITVRYLTTHRRQTDSRVAERLFVRGAGPGLSWDHSLELRKTGRLDTWKVSIEYEVDETSFDCSSTTHCSYNQYAVEFRVYGDQSGEEDMIGPNFFFRLPASKSSIASDFLSPDLVAYPWFDNKKITFKTILVNNPHLFRPTSKTKNLIAFPPSFEYNTLRTYPLVVMFGIKELMTMVQVLERGFVHDASVQEAVIVAVEYTGCLLLPYFGGKWECQDQQNCAQNCLYCWDRERTEPCEEYEFRVQLRACAVEMACGGSGDIILDYVMNHLVPEVQKETRYRVEVAFPGHRIHIVGYNEGGLLACHAAVKYPHIFKSATCMSAPFHWPEKSFTFGYQLTQMIKDIAAENMSYGLYSLYQTQKYYIDTGDRDSYFYPIVDSYLDAEKFVEELEESFHMEGNIFRMNFPKFAKGHVVDPHNSAFVQRIRYALQMLLPIDGGPNRRYPRIPIEYTQGNYKIHVPNATSVETASEPPQECEKELVTVPIFLIVVFVTMALSISMTVLIMCLRESNKRSEDEKAGSDSDEMDDSDSLSDYDN